MSKEACQVCPRACLLAPGQVGLCQARQNFDGEIVSLSYGQVTALGLDPIEKKPFHGFYPGSKILSVGSFGCNMTCPFCQNYRIARAGPADLRSRYLSPQALVDLADQARAQGNIGLAFTYNEPLINYEYVLKSSRLAQEKSLKVALVTNGQVSESYLKELLPYVDAWNVDLKTFDEGTYKRLGGSLEATKRTIRLASQGAHVEVSSLIVPGISDDLDDFARQLDFLDQLDKPIILHLARYFPAYKYGEPPTDLALLKEMEAMAKAKLARVNLANV